MQEFNWDNNYMALEYGISSSEIKRYLGLMSKYFIQDWGFLEYSFSLFLWKTSSSYLNFWEYASAIIVLEY